MLNKNGWALVLATFSAAVISGFSGCGSGSSSPAPTLPGSIVGNTTGTTCYETNGYGCLLSCSSCNESNYSYPSGVGNNYGYPSGSGNMACLQLSTGQCEYLSYNSINNTGSTTGVGNSVCGGTGTVNLYGTQYQICTPPNGNYEGYPLWIYYQGSCTYVPTQDQYTCG